MSKASRSTTVTKFVNGPLVPSSPTKKLGSTNVLDFGDSGIELHKDIKIIEDYMTSPPTISTVSGTISGTISGTGTVSHTLPVVTVADRKVHPTGSVQSEAAMTTSSVDILSMSGDSPKRRTSCWKVVACPTAYDTTVHDHKLFVCVIEAKDLSGKGKNGFSDPYAVLYVRKQQKYRTAVLWQDLTPRWLEYFTLTVSDEDKRLRLNIWDKDRLKRDEFLGRAEIPLQSLNDHRVHTDWYSLQSKKNLWGKMIKVSGQVRIKFRFAVKASALRLLKMYPAMSGYAHRVTPFEGDWSDEAYLCRLRKNTKRFQPSFIVFKDDVLYIYETPSDAEPIVMLCMWTTFVENASQKIELAHCFALTTHEGESHVFRVDSGSEFNRWLNLLRFSKHTHSTDIGESLAENAPQLPPLMHQRSSELRRTSLCNIFSIAPAGNVETFPCSLLDGNKRLNGHLFVDDAVFCFHSEVMTDTRITIPIQEILLIDKMEAVLAFDLNVFTIQGKIYRFCAFPSVSKVHLTLTDRWNIQLGEKTKTEMLLKVLNVWATVRQFREREKIKLERGQVQSKVVLDNLDLIRKALTGSEMPQFIQELEAEEGEGADSDMIQHADIRILSKSSKRSEPRSPHSPCSPVGSDVEDSTGQAKKYRIDSHSNQLQINQHQRPKALGLLPDLGYESIQPLPLSSPSHLASRRNHKLPSVNSSIPQSVDAFTERSPLRPAESKIEPTERSRGRAKTTPFKISSEEEKPKLRKRGSMLPNIATASTGAGIGLDDPDSPAALVGYIQQSEKEQNADWDRYRTAVAALMSESSSLRVLEWDVYYSDLVKTKQLGKGSFGTVYLVHIKHRENDQFALKQILKSKLTTAGRLEKVKREIDILRHVSFPFIVQCHGSFEDDRFFGILMENVSGGELYDLIKQRRLTESEARFYAVELILAIEYLHNHQIAYRDIKAENVLIESTGHIRLADLGFAKRIEYRSWTMCGTPEYLAPELVQNRGHGLGVDWWALGCLIFEMVTGKTPFVAPTEMECFEKIINGKILFPRNLCSKPFKDLIKRLCEQDLSKRLGCMKSLAKDIKTHPWFASVNWSEAAKSKMDPPFLPVQGAAEKMFLPTNLASPELKREISNRSRSNTTPS
eukprot:GILK01000725.1.p1 GENE.GILK01000725.1~~GILK01000725.1.p1  ORF type:complete len:1151 (+),score=234.53 GILK01000725.1:71-3454(+)